MDATHTAAAASPVVSQIRTLLLCDLTESTRLVEQVGDRRAAELMRRHDQLVRHLLQQHAGREIDKSDGFLALFEHPVQAVAFALDYQRELRALGNAEGWPLSARVGIHVGDVLLWENTPGEIARGAKPVNVEGLAKPVAARLMQLALPGQILLSGVAYSLASRAGGQALPERVSWCTHGRYRFKGVPAPMLVHEVGEPGFAPLRAPVSGDKAWRDVPLWRRPAVLGAQLLGLSAVAAIVAMATLRTPDAIAFRERDWVVVGSLNNLTGDPRFDGTLETALRISLEQSRHVNVLPNLRVRDALQRMGQAPDSPVDRDSGSEVALREGARALLLPTVAEVGGRLRVSLELVDPNTQRTVHVESADGAGIESALRSLGVVGDRLRERLGEAVKSIEQSSAPLEKATSPSLDALRAYTLATQAFSVASLDEAHLHLQHALMLDPEFAIAHAAMARYHLAGARYALALQSLQRAVSLEHRLSEREKLHVNALTAMVSHQRDYPEKWRVLADMYPDHHAAAHNYAMAMWYEGRFDEGLAYATRAAVPQSITRASSTYLQGIHALGLDRFEAARAHFQEARSLGLSPSQNQMASAVHAAERNFAEALRVLGAVPSRDPGEQLVRSQLLLAMIVDQGRWAEARSLADDIHRQALDLAEGPTRWIALGAHLAGYRFDAQIKARAGDVFAQVLPALHAEHPVDRERAASLLLYCGLLGADAGDIGFARRAIDAVGGIPVASPQSTLSDLVRIVESQVANTEGRHDDALALLQPVLAGGHGPLWAYRAAMDAHAGLGNHENAYREATRLAGHRGRAYAEFTGNMLMQAENVLQSNLALLRAAEIAHDMGRPDDARRHLAAFERAWPEPVPDPQLRDRVEALSQRLSRQKP
ncbi:putative peptide modification system cyclase [Rehaibacterium terrae]|uniref:Putative peptide modification system cyclase n=1 Tax=Rehaibacterium terrae TaxID=1341696 RepID=A0A7W7Y138_9GAMM|nr:putative peptide modification system cyclase [Rehaibacterium terrae]